MHRQQQRVLWGSQSSQSLQLFYRCRASTSLRSNNCSKCRIMGVSRVLHVSRSLHFLYQGFLTSIFPISDDVNDRTLPTGVAVTTNTIESCTAACYNAGFPIAGAEYSTQCFCSTSIGGSGALASASDCNMLCSGNSSEYCGGPDRLNLYNYTGTPPTVPPPPPPGTTAVYPVTGLPGNWTYDGCWM